MPFHGMFAYLNVATACVLLYLCMVLHVFPSTRSSKEAALSDYILHLPRPSSYTSTRDFSKIVEAADDYGMDEAVQNVKELGVRPWGGALAAAVPPPQVALLHPSRALFCPQRRRTAQDCSERNCGTGSGTTSHCTPFGQFMKEVRQTPQTWQSNP